MQKNNDVIVLINYREKELKEAGTEKRGRLCPRREVGRQNW